MPRHAIAFLAHTAFKDVAGGSVATTLRSSMDTIVGYITGLFTFVRPLVYTIIRHVCTQPTVDLHCLPHICKSGISDRVT
jgi:hypothetical protein